MRWPAYLRAVLAFSAAGVLFLYLLQRVQGGLPLSLGFASISPDQAFNTAASFVANTNWQSYSGEQAMGHVVQTAGLAVQNFVSAATAWPSPSLVAARTESAASPADPVRPASSATSGPTWCAAPSASCSRSPSSARSSWSPAAPSRTSPASTRSPVMRRHPSRPTGGAVASQEVIKELGTNGGGYFNANSAHPFENPNAFTNLFEIFLILRHPVRADPRPSAGWSAT